MARRIESLFVNGPAGRLEALLEEPEHGDPVAAALVCHPHPAHGGTMHNKVVHRLARALRHNGCVVLRFNFRGVNLSEGEYGHWVGERQDAEAALDHLRRLYPDLPYGLAGFSFGARIILQMGCSVEGARLLIPVGFPTRYQTEPEYATCVLPKHFIQSTMDEFGPRPSIDEFVASLPDPKVLTFVPAEDHFFKGSLEALEEAVRHASRPLAGLA